jgi:uncharacterized protein with ParB-like and HNH nuclease domain
MSIILGTPFIISRQESRLSDFFPKSLASFIYCPVFFFWKEVNTREKPLKRIELKKRAENPPFDHKRLYPGYQLNVHIMFVCIWSEAVMHKLFDLMHSCKRRGRKPVMTGIIDRKSN